MSFIQSLQERAMNIATWIDIAQELRVLKNFSSLKAIVSGLQSNAVYRLSKTWGALPREKVWNLVCLTMTLIINAILFTACSAGNI